MSATRTWVLGLAVAGVLAALSASACGSQGDGEQPEQPVSYQAGATETTERPDRQSTVAAGQPDQAEQAEQSTIDSEQADAEPEDDGAVREVLRRHREGLQANRNVVGDPNAPITIVEYSDFQ